MNPMHIVFSPIRSIHSAIQHSFGLFLISHFPVWFGQNHHRTAPHFCNHICGVQGVVRSVLNWHIFQNVKANYLFTINRNENMTISFFILKKKTYVTKQVTQIYIIYIRQIKKSMTNWQ